ncbi:MAG: hypothetical protein RL095_2149 [Verrucomicrobiota bacterium]
MIMRNRPVEGLSHTDLLPLALGLLIADLVQQLGGFRATPMGDPTAGIVRFSPGRHVELLGCGWHHRHKCNISES